MADFHIITSVPFSLKPGAIERALRAFVKDTERKVVPNQVGRYNQILAYIHSCLMQNSIPNAQVWIKEDEDGEVGAFALTQFKIDVDNQLSLWLTVAWVRGQHRFNREVKEWFHQMEDFGKAGGAKHLLIPSIRGSRGYLRFVGKGWHEYEVILKRDL